MKSAEYEEILASLQEIVRQAYALGRSDALKQVVEVLKTDDMPPKPLALMAPAEGPPAVPHEFAVPHEAEAAHADAAPHEAAPDVAHESASHAMPGSIQDNAQQAGPNADKPAPAAAGPWWSRPARAS